MSPPVPIAFYAPLKSPDHPVPSGDRTMARLLMAALDRAGFAPELTSRMRSHDPAGDTARQVSIREAGLLDAERIVAAIRGWPVERRPRLWFTYHVYYKAPDWIGPAVADALGIPYVVAEGSRASKRAEGPWALSHQGAEAALDRADAILVMTSADREALARDRPLRQLLVDLPPFVDTAHWPTRSAARPLTGAARLVTVAMMRAGDKLASYRELADALARSRQDWTLDVIGDGPARGEVSALLAPFGSRVRMLGRIDEPGVLARILQGADLFVWPAVNEAYGMALLEAQACGVPVLAGDHGGVADVVRHGVTGRLVRPGAPAAFAASLDELLRDRVLLGLMSEPASAFVHGERGLDGSAARLRRVLEPLTEAAWA